MIFTQKNIYLSISTALGADKLLLTAFQGEEWLSGLFSLTLDMVSEDTNIGFDNIVGKDATITLSLDNGSTRYLNGIITRFYQGGSDGRFTRYCAELRPWLWLLTLTADSRIFQQQSVPEILEAVFSDLGFTDFKNNLTKAYDQRAYTVQYQETAFDFVSRLMEEEGIFYFFQHEDGKHTLIFADDADAHRPCPGLSAAVRYQSSLEGETQADAVTNCTLEQQVTTGAYLVDDFNFETSTADLLASVSGKDDKLSIYQYPGRILTHDASEARAKVRLEAVEAAKTWLRGEGFTPAFTAGHTFALVGHERNEANTKYVLQRVQHHASMTSYTNAFDAFPAATPFRPRHVTPKPIIPGTQTAIVVGKSGEEIWTDEHGRIKVQFHWDRQGKNDENSSCWIRVAQGWAGKTWGGLFIPRIGQEVVISFVNGDPDRPLVTGSVYNDAMRPPYALPDEQTKSTIKSNSSKEGEGFNEIRFEDKKEEEEIYIHAQRDMTVEILNDETRTVTQNRTTTLQEGNETVTIAKGDRLVAINEGNETLTIEKGNRTVQVNTGSETHTVKGKRDLAVSDTETHKNEADFTQEVAGSYTLKVSGDLILDVSGSITIKAGQNLTNKAGQNIESSAGQNLTNKAGMSLTNEAGMSLTSKGNASQTVESSGIVSVKGAMVKLN